MASKDRMTITDFTKRTELRNYTLQSTDNQLFYVDPQFLSIWSDAFRVFLENEGINQLQVYNAPVSGSQLLLFLKLIHAQAIFEANNPQECEEFLGTIDALNAVPGLKEAAAFYCFYQSSSVEWAKVFMKSLVIFGGADASAQSLFHNFKGITSVDTFQAAIDERMVDWLLSKGSNNISKQILMYMKSAQGIPDSITASQQNAQLCWERLRKSKEEAQAVVNFDVELCLGEAAAFSVLSNRRLLANQSSVFASMLCGSFEDGQNQKVHLPEESNELHHNLMFDMLLPTFTGCFWRFKMWSIRYWPDTYRKKYAETLVRLFGHLSGLETEQKLNNTNDQNELLSAQRNLFAVSDKYDILAINTYMVNEIVASEAYFPIEELIELGDKYHNDAIVDAGFNKLSREAAIRLIIEKETIWKQYGKATQERLMLALGKLLQAI